MKLKELLMKVVKVVKEQVISTVISGIICIVATVGLFHFTSQPNRSPEVREKKV